jgi:hypothetical protein
MAFWCLQIQELCSQLSRHVPNSIYVILIIQFCSEFEGKFRTHAFFRRKCFFFIKSAPGEAQGARAVPCGRVAKCDLLEGLCEVVPLAVVKKALGAVQFLMDTDFK